ncbi:MAG: glucosamine-6-phosphate deaminase [bacterium]|nr:glucosamine-6-phosphate deaminase [bacterium]MDE0139537.1 glucosamine-6-phosphate deaminase [bacterium]MDE0352330.1 glucosamine-6-phosphate deaminase [bacterium]
MEVVVASSAEEMAARAAGIVGTFLRSVPSPVLGLATGASVQPLYRELVRRHREESLSFAAARAFLLDEYVGLDHDHPQLYRNVVRAELTGLVDLRPARLFSPDVHAADMEEECARYDRRVRRARIGLQILGIGRNGHLAFNEPGSAFDSRTRVVSLTATTRADNARFFGNPDEMPRCAVTQGLGTIMGAGHLMVMASGAAKAVAVQGALLGPVAEALPASILRTHPRVTLVVDRRAVNPAVAGEAARMRIPIR